MPPTPCTANTSSESSILSLPLTIPTNQKQMIAAKMPKIIAPPGPITPAAGVIVANPATAPVANPTAVALPTLIRSIKSHTNAAAEAPICVLIIALAAASLAANADPPLKPNQPTHNNPAPATVRAGLWGNISVLGKPIRLPSISATISAETPAVVWTTMPPAKSITPCSAKNPLPQTQRVTGT